MTAPRSPPAVGLFFPAAPKLGRRSKCRVMETVAASGCMTVTSSPAFGFLSGALFLQLTERPRWSRCSTNRSALPSHSSRLRRPRALSPLGRAYDPGTPCRSPARGVSRPDASVENQTPGKEFSCKWDSRAQSRLPRTAPPVRFPRLSGMRSAHISFLISFPLPLGIPALPAPDAQSCSRS